MTDPFQNILQSGNLPVNNLPVSSRYYAVGTTTIELADKRKVVYIKRRFIPPAEKLELITEHIVKKGDRLDNIAASYIGDPEQFWQVADANNAMKPSDLTEEPGEKIRITQPLGARIV
ncbi:MAG: LysM domain-containing protein [Ginsengibacter sp.]